MAKETIKWTKTLKTQLQTPDLNPFPYIFQVLFLFLIYFSSSKINNQKSEAN